MIQLPPLLWLQAFESAVRTLSFTAAGSELGVTQAAISQRIRLLEDRLGQKLFVRHARSLTLTPAGQAWLPSIHDAFSRISEGTTEVFGMTSEKPVTLRATPVRIWFVVLTVLMLLRVLIRKKLSLLLTAPLVSRRALFSS